MKVGCDLVKNVPMEALLRLEENTYPNIYILDPKYDFSHSTNHVNFAKSPRVLNRILRYSHEFRGFLLVD